MNEIQKVAAKFHSANPHATERQAEQAADIEFSEGSDQRKFLAFWKKLHDQTAAIRQAELESGVEGMDQKEKYHGTATG